MILARSQKGNGHGVRRQIAVSKQRSRECRDLGLKSTDVDPRRLCASAEGRISTQLEHLEPRLKSNTFPWHVGRHESLRRFTSADLNRFFTFWRLAVLDVRLARHFGDSLRSTFD